MSYFAELIIVILFALAIGSFITMASYRFTVDNESLKELLFGRSHCVSCKRKLKIRNLVPIFSWIFQKGKCSFCKTGISIRYPLIELTTVVSFIAVYLVYRNLDFKLMLFFLMTTTLLIMVVTDLEYYFIPNSTQIALLILGIIYHFSFKNAEHSFLYFTLSAFAFAIFGLVIKYGFLLITKKDGIGIDDIKFFFVAGFLIGISGFTTFMILNGILGIIFGSIWKKFAKEDTFPFAPALALSLMFTILTAGKIDYVQIISSWIIL